MQLAWGSALARVVRSFALIAAVSISACDSDETKPMPDAGRMRGDSGAPNRDGGAQDAAMCPSSRALVFGACASTEAGYGGDGSGGWSLSGVSIKGSVDAIERGWSFDCEGLGRSGGQDGQSWSFHVRDGTRAMWVGIVLPWRAPFIKVGDKVSVEYRYGTDNEDGLTPGVMTMRDGDGVLLFWAQLAYETKALTLPKELDVHDAKTFECDDGCGRVSMSGFQVQSGGDEVVLDSGERGEVGDYVVFHGRNAQGVEMTGDCSDWFVHVSQLTAVRGSIASLDARDAKPCGGASCNDDQFCAVPMTSTCDSWDPGSVCTDAETACADDCAGVCGCDGRFYCNACKAHAAGTDVAEDTKCPQMH